jgi:PTS system mannose-specific IIB component
VIVLVRVDNRLLHGQILEAWIPRLRADRVIVADDEAAESPLAQAAMCLCLPPDVAVEIMPVRDIDYAGLAADPARSLVLLRDVSDLARAHASGLSARLAPVLNVGNVHFSDGRHAVTPSVFLSSGEVQALRALAGEGFAVEARAIPAEAPTGMDEIERRYAAAH